MKYNVSSPVYHMKCVDPWLTKNKRSCPVCKRKVIPGTVVYTIDQLFYIHIFILNH